MGHWGAANMGSGRRGSLIGKGLPSRRCVESRMVWKPAAAEACPERAAGATGAEPSVGMRAKRSRAWAKVALRFASLGMREVNEQVRRPI